MQAAGAVSTPCAGRSYSARAIGPILRPMVRWRLFANATGFRFMPTSAAARQAYTNARPHARVLRPAVGEERAGRGLAGAGTVPRLSPAAIKNFLANQRDRAHALKRGGGARTLSLDLEYGESRLRMEPAHDLTPELLFQRQWVHTLLDFVMRRLQDEYQAAGKGVQFERLKDVLTGGRERLPYAAVAAELGMSEQAAPGGQPLAERYREMLREEVSDTVAEPDEIDDEIRSLFAVL